MSTEATRYVWNHSPYKATQKLIHLALGEIANAGHDWRLWVGDQHIADQVGCDRRSVTRTKALMVEDGYLEPHGFDAETGNKQYLFLMPSTSGRDVASPGQDPVEKQDPMGHLIHPDGTSHPPAPITNRTEPKTPCSPPTLELIPQPPPDPSEFFARFWDAYPRKVGKRQAEAAWWRALRRGTLPLAISDGARRYADDPNREDGFTAHPTTWLNRDGWDDPPLPARAQRGDPLRRGGPSIASLWQQAADAEARRPLGSGTQPALESS